MDAFSVKNGSRPTTPNLISREYMVRYNPDHVLKVEEEIKLATKGAKKLAPKPARKVDYRTLDPYVRPRHRSHMQRLQYEARNPKVQQLADLVRGRKHTLEEIANELNLTLNTTKCYLSAARSVGLVDPRIKVKRATEKPTKRLPHYTQELIEKSAEMALQGKTKTQIGWALNRSNPSIREYLKRAKKQGLLPHRYIVPEG